MLPSRTKTAASGAWTAVHARTLVQLLRESCERWPNRPLIIFEDGLALTRADFRERVEGFTGYLDGAVGAGDRVVISTENRAEFLIGFLAVVAKRATVVPLNPASGAADASHVLGSSGARVAIVDTTAGSFFGGSDFAPGFLTIRLDAAEPDGLPTAERRLDLNAAPCRPDDLVAITYTSGTTGLPKGCMIDHVWALRATDVALRVHSYGPDDRIFYPVKFFYMDALLALLRALQSGGAFVAARRFSVGRFWDVVRRHDVTVLSTVASMPAFLLKASPSSDDRRHNVRFAIQAQIVPELHAAMDERWGFPWLENYGMTEVGIIARAPLDLADELRGTGSAGPPAPEVDVRIVDTNGEVVPAGSPGEIQVRQPGMFRGYLDLPDATEAMFANGWIRTGDLGTLDSSGYVTVAGRIKDVIRRSGENISAVEVEAVLTSHPDVLDAAVIGVLDADHGEEVKAFIQLVDGLSADRVPPATLAEYCAGRLAPHKIPRFFAFVGEFPRTASMRVRKELLRASNEESPEWDRSIARWSS